MPVRWNHLYELSPVFKTHIPLLRHQTSLYLWGRYQNYWTKVFRLMWPKQDRFLQIYSVQQQKVTRLLKSHHIYGALGKSLCLEDWPLVAGNLTSDPDPHCRSTPIGPPLDPVELGGAWARAFTTLDPKPDGPENKAKPDGLENWVYQAQRA
jgi:hypothetical protein